MPPRKRRAASRHSPSQLAAKALTLGGLAALGYALWWEPAMQLRRVRWRLSPKAWRGRDDLRIVVLSDIHAGAPHLGPARLRRIVARANALKPDLAVLLGDYAAAHPFTWGFTDKADILDVLKDFTAPLGTYAVLGNHDWWQDPAAQKRRKGPLRVEELLRERNIPHLDNRAVRLGGEGGFWLAGLGDQRPFTAGPDGDGFDDLEGAMRGVTDDAPVVLLAHEPDIFDDLADTEWNIPLQISGHTHGGQIRIAGSAPLILASDNETYSWGRYDKGDHTMILSGGLGCSVLPMRVGVAPEITVIELLDPAKNA